jgi:gluconokinase
MALIVVMGVSGSGKSTVARVLAQRLACPMLEGDSLHSADNIRRMSAGIPLTDDDRRGWLEAIAQRIAGADARGLVVACSALKRSARDILRRDAPSLLFVYLAGSRRLLEARLQARRNHFMPLSLLDSQLQTLEQPGTDENVLTCGIVGSPESIVDSVMMKLRS